MLEKRTLWFIIIIITAALVFVLINQQSVPPSIKATVAPLSEDDFSIKGVKPYELISEEVFKKLGNPQKIEVVESEDAGKYKEYYYQNFVIMTRFEENNKERITQFCITGIDFSLARGIKLGDSTDKLFAKYGSVKILDNTCFYKFEPKDPNARGYNLEFDIVNNKIDRIWLK